MKTKLVAVLLAIGWGGTAQAAEKIRYEEIPDRIVAHSGGATVFTTDGMRHAGAKFRLEPDRVVLYQKDGSIENIPVDQIARVAIKHERPHFSEFHQVERCCCCLFAVLGVRRGSCMRGARSHRDYPGCDRRRGV